MMTSAKTSTFGFNNVVMKTLNQVTVPAVRTPSRRHSFKAMAQRYEATAMLKIGRALGMIDTTLPSNKPTARIAIE